MKPQSEGAGEPLSIDVVSDVVCPWCFIGKRKLEAALAENPGAPVDIRWRPFQLDPTIPPGGIPRRQYLEKKFGAARIDEIHTRLTEAGREVGIEFALDRIAVSPNTLDAHRLIRWAQTTGHQGAVKEALLRAYFLEGRDIGDRAVLLEVAAASGLDAALVTRLFAEGADIQAVTDEIASAVRLGVTGVPFFIFANKFAVPGAQSAEVLAGAITKARAEAAQPTGLA